MHRALKADATKPPGADLSVQQRMFKRFRNTYNDIRPHEALDDETPASRWGPSSRPLPETLSPPEYPGHIEVRRVSNAGTFRLHSKQRFLSQALAGQHIGLEQINDGIWNILFYNTLLGRFDEPKNNITGAPALRKKC